jgi:hypothetical protein
MKTHLFYGNEHKDKINPMEWLRFVNEYDMTPSRVGTYFLVNLGSGG